MATESKNVSICFSIIFPSLSEKWFEKLIVVHDPPVRWMEADSVESRFFTSSGPHNISTVCSLFDLILSYR